MSNIYKHALREVAEKAQTARARLESMSDEDVVLFEENDIKSDVSICNKFIVTANPETVLALLDELEAANKRNTELNEALKQAVSGYKSCLRTGYERILELSGDCDSPEVMIAGNPDIQHAEKLIAAASGNGE